MRRVSGNDGCCALLVAGAVAAMILQPGIGRAGAAEESAAASDSAL